MARASFSVFGGFAATDLPRSADPCTPARQERPDANTAAGYTPRAARPYSRKPAWRISSANRASAPRTPPVSMSVPVDCIHPRKDEPEFQSADMLYIHPDECIDCGACVPACPVEAIFALDETPEKWKSFIPVNAEYFQKVAGSSARRQRSRWVGGAHVPARVGPCGRFAGCQVGLGPRSSQLRCSSEPRWSVRGAADTDADLQFQLATLLYDETRYQEALQAFDQATQERRPAHCRSRAQGQGPHGAEGRRVRPRARREAETLRKIAPTDAEAIALYGDALWSAGLFDEADRAYRDGARRRRPIRRARGSASPARWPPPAASRRRSTWRSPRRPRAPRDGEIHAADRRHLRAAAPLRRRPPTPIATTSTCCPTRTAARRRRGRARRSTSSTRSATRRRWRSTSRT